MDQKKIWKDIPLDWAEEYEVSNYGEIRRKGKSKPRKLVEDDNGYLNTMITHEGTYHQLYAHRAVALAFLTNDDPEHKYMVSHLDEVCTHNWVDNLAWATPSENSKMPKLLEMRQGAKTHKRSVKQYDLEGNLLSTYGSIREASEAVDRGTSSIFKVLQGKRKTSAGYIWEYAD